MVIDLIFIFVSYTVVKLVLVYFHTEKFMRIMYDKENWEELRKIHRPADGDKFLKNLFHPFRWTYSQMFDEI